MKKEFCKIEDVLLEVRQAALAAGCPVLSSDPESPCIDVLSKLQARPLRGEMDGDEKDNEAPVALESSGNISDFIPSKFHGISELLHLEWWPLKLLVQPNLIDSTSTSFRIIAGAHFLGAFVACGIILGFIIRRIIIDSILVVSDFDHYYTLPWNIFTLCLEFGFVLFWVHETWRIGYATCRSYLSNPSDAAVEKDREDTS
jgi:hypothetical protein